VNRLRSAAMRRAVWSGVLMVGGFACSSQQEPPRPNAVCPPGLESEIWARELFPGCPPAPFQTVGVVCDGGCPRPCEGTIETGSEVLTMRYEYAKDGSWARTLQHTERSDSEGRPPPRPGLRYCEGTGRHRECEIADPYLRGLDDDRSVAKYTIDAAGNVIEVERIHYNDAVKLTYNGRRLMSELHPSGLVRKYHYDARGRIGTIEANAGGRNAATYTYDDATNRLTRLARTAPYEPDDVTTFEYDDRGRPIHITRTLGASPMVWRYSYDCPAR